MIGTISSFGQLAASSLRQYKTRALTATITWAIVAIATLFATGFASVALVVWLAAVYDWIIALVFVSALYLIIACLAIATNAIVQRQAKKKLKKASAARGAVVATGLAAATQGFEKNKKPALAFAIVGLLIATQLANNRKSTE